MYVLTLVNFKYPLLAQLEQCWKQNNVGNITHITFEIIAL